MNSCSAPSVFEAQRLKLDYRQLLLDSSSQDIRGQFEALRDFFCKDLQESPSKTLHGALKN